MRCFVAVDLDTSLRPALIELQHTLQDGIPVAPENLHFTLKFLGEIDEAAIAVVSDTLVRIAAQTAAFPLVIQGLGAFPTMRAPRIAWLGAPALLNLQLLVDETLAPRFPREQDLVPHLTITRFREPPTNYAIFARRHEQLALHMRVVDIRLKRSTLTARGPVYEDVKVFPLS